MPLWSRKRQLAWLGRRQWSLCYSVALQSQQPQLLWLLDASRAPPKLATWTTTHIFADLGFVQHTCSPLSLCAKSEHMAIACCDLLLLWLELPLALQLCVTSYHQHISLVLSLLPPSKPLSSPSSHTSNSPLGVHTHQNAQADLFGWSICFRLSQAAFSSPWKQELVWE